MVHMLQAGTLASCSKFGQVNQQPRSLASVQVVEGCLWLPALLLPEETESQGLP